MSSLLKLTNIRLGNVCILLGEQDEES